MWAIVYAYDPPAAPRSLWYDRWRYDVINDYVEAVSFLGAEPLIIDVDSFVASDRLKSREIALVINLNSGATPISNLGLVPSISEWHKIPCFPNSADVVLSGERKDLCKRFFASWFNIPTDLDLDHAMAGLLPFIAKPKTMGNSQGVVKILPHSNPNAKVDLNNSRRDTLIEEFIEGYEVTVPVLFDAEKNDYVVCPPIVYVPEVDNPTEWFLSYQEKMDRKVKLERRVGLLAPEAVAALLDASRSFNFSALARYDFRWKCRNIEVATIELQDLWFLEINCLPTLRTDVNFLKSVKSFLSKQSDPLIDYVMSARTEDIAALSYLLAQFFLRASKTKYKSTESSFRSL